jgi:hypothetical protein
MLGYRSIFSIDGEQDSHRVFVSAINSWLRSKDILIDIAEWQSKVWNSNNGKIDFSYTFEIADSKRKRYWFELREITQSGHYTSRVVLVIERGPKTKLQTVLIEVEKENANPNSIADEISPPRIAKIFLQEARCLDGTWAIEPRALPVRLADVDEAMERILDPDRKFSLLVGLSPAADLDHPWVNVMSDLIGETQGNATALALSNEVSQAINHELGEDFKIPVGGVRTFHPGVDLGSHEDAIRHRILGPLSLARNISQVGAGSFKVSTQIMRRLGQSTRLRFTDPRVRVGVKRDFEILERKAREEYLNFKVEAQQLADANEASENPIVARTIETNAAANATHVGLVGDMLSVDELVALEKRVKELSAKYDIFHKESLAQSVHISDLRNELDVERETSANALLDRAVAEERARSIERENFEFRRIMRANNLFGELATAEVVFEEPPNIEELVLRLLPGSDFPEAKFIEFTGDADIAIDVDRYDSVGNYAGEFWRYVLTMVAYSKAVLANEFSGNLHMFIKDYSRAEFTVPITQYSHDESTSTKNKYPRTRNFPIPKEVDQRGFVEMWAHFKPTHRDRYAPRMHIYTDLANTGKCYIGYIGRHLPNTKTN